VPHGKGAVEKVPWKRCRMEKVPGLFSASENKPGTFSGTFSGGEMMSAKKIKGRC